MPEWVSAACAKANTARFPACRCRCLSAPVTCNGVIRGRTFLSRLLDRVEEPKAANYLKKEFAERIVDANIEYRLQVQLHEWDSETDTHMLYNPAKAWDENEHPWINVATISLTSLLPDDVTENTRFNIANLPESTLSIQEGTSVTDFNIVPTIRKEVYFWCQKMRPNEPPPSKEEKVVYLVHVVTGKRYQCGNLDKNCNIYISIIGSCFHLILHAIRQEASLGLYPFLKVHRTIPDHPFRTRRQNTIQEAGAQDNEGFRRGSQVHFPHR